jgi:hypothetical protein
VIFRNRRYRGGFVSYRQIRGLGVSRQLATIRHIAAAKPTSRE